MVIKKNEKLLHKFGLIAWYVLGILGLIIGKYFLKIIVKHFLYSYKFELGQDEQAQIEIIISNHSTILNP